MGNGTVRRRCTYSQPAAIQPPGFAVSESGVAHWMFVSASEACLVSNGGAAAQEALAPAAECELPMARFMYGAALAARPKKQRLRQRRAMHPAGVRTLEAADDMKIEKHNIVRGKLGYAKGARPDVDCILCAVARGDPKVDNLIVHFGMSRTWMSGCPRWLPQRNLRMFWNATVGLVPPQPASKADTCGRKRCQMRRGSVPNRVKLYNQFPLFVRVSETTLRVTFVLLLTKILLGNSKNSNHFK